jgi:tetratricopeptide (TPR) repeat protein
LAVTVSSVIPGAQQLPATSSPKLQQGVDWNPEDPDRVQGFQLYEQHKLPAAASSLEKVVARYPRDVVAHERLGMALLGRADTQTDPAKRKADRLQARAELLRARDLGDNSDLAKTLIAGIPEDGNEAAFSSRQEVDDAMNRGEAAYANGEWERAIQEYSHALVLDPKLYLAAVDLGDTYFVLKQMDKAGDWFAVAIQIEPNAETAYRYWGDALLAEGKMKEAREKFIQGLVANPYRQSSWSGLHNWVNRNKVKLKEISIQTLAASTVGPDGKVTVTLDNSILDKKDNQGVVGAWMTYSIERSRWQTDKFAKEYPQEKSYRHSLKEETAALSTAATVFEELENKKKSKNPDPSLALLSQLKADGLIEAYVLLMKADDGITRDYAAYQANHRDQLIRFVDKYVVPPAP